MAFVSTATSGDKEESDKEEKEQSKENKGQKVRKTTLEQMDKFKRYGIGAKIAQQMGFKVNYLILFIYLFF